MNRDRPSESSRSRDQTPGSTGRRPESGRRRSESSRSGDQTPRSTGQRPESRHPQPEGRDPAGEQTPLLSPRELTTQSPTAGDYIRAFCNFMTRCCSTGTTSDTPSRPASQIIPPRLVVEEPRPIDPLPNLEATGATHPKESQSPVDSHLVPPRAGASSVGRSTEFQIAEGLTRRPPSDSEEAGLETSKQMDASPLTTTSTGIESNMERLREERDVHPSRNDNGQGSSDISGKIVKWQRERLLSPKEGTSKQSEAIESRIETAKQGFERFKTSYEAGDEKWKDFLTKTSGGKTLALVLLGIKPCAEFTNNDNKEKAVINMLRSNSGEDFGIADGHIVHREGCLIVFLENSVRKVLETHSEYFPGYTSESPAGLYINQIEKFTATEDRKEKDKQRGLLFGITRKNVEEYAEHVDKYEEFMGMMRLRGISKLYFHNNPKRKALRDEGEKLREYYGSDDPTHRATLTEAIHIIKEYARSEDEAQYLLERGIITIVPSVNEGEEEACFQYIGRLGSPANEQLAEETELILKESGIADFFRRKRKRKMFIVGSDEDEDE
jgi:hypothetical protein